MNTPASNSHGNLQHLSSLPTVSQQVQCETSISKGNQNYRSTVSLTEPNLQPYNLSSSEGVTSFTADKRNDSGYEDAFNQSRTDLHRMQGFHNKSGVYDNNLVTKLSFTGLSSSSVCSDAYYYAGSESSAISNEVANSFNMNKPCFKSSNCCTPVGYDCHATYDYSSHQQSYNGHVTLLAPLHRYAAPGKDILYSNTQSVHLNKMVVSP